MVKLFARCKSDMDTEWWNHMPRSESPNWDKRDDKGTWDAPPATVPLSITPEGHTKDRFALPKDWINYVGKINGGIDSPEYKALMRKAGGWNNVGDIENPKVESLSWWGSVLEIREVAGSSATVKTFGHRNPAPSTAMVNYDNNPELVHQFTAISGEGKMRLLGGRFSGFFDNDCEESSVRSYGPD